MAFVILAVVFWNFLPTCLKRFTQKPSQTEHGVQTRYPRLLFSRDYILIPAILAGLVAYILRPLHEALLVFPMPFWLVIIGAVFGALSSFLKIWGYWALNGNWSEGRTIIVKDHCLITSGPYRFIRHPVYFSYMLLALGIMMMTGSILLFILFLCLSATTILRAREEEDRLSEEFGERYLVYQKSTGKFFPIIFRFGLRSVQPLSEEI